MPFTAYIHRNNSEGIVGYNKPDGSFIPLHIFSDNLFKIFDKEVVKLEYDPNLGYDIIPVPTQDNIPTFQIRYKSQIVAVSRGGGGGGIKGINVQEEGVPIGTKTTFNFVGAGVTATNVGGGVAEININGGIGMFWALDGNTNAIERYIGTNDTFDFPIYTDGTEKMRVLTTGEVGIGTAAPSFFVEALRNQNGETSVAVTNTDAGNNSVALFVSTSDFALGFFGTASLAHINPEIAGKVFVRADNTDLVLSAFVDMIFTTGNSERMRILSTGQVGIGTATPNTSAILDLSSTLGALLIPRMTTAQKLALTPVNGMIVYDSTLNKFQGYEAGVWTSFI